MYRSNAGFLLSAVAALTLVGGPVAQLFCRCGCSGPVNVTAQSQDSRQVADCCRKAPLGKDGPANFGQTQDGLFVVSTGTIGSTPASPQSLCCCKKLPAVSVPISMDAKPDSLQADTVEEFRTPVMAANWVVSKWQMYSKPPPPKQPLFLQYARILT